MTVDRDAIERARMRLAETSEGRPDDAALQALLERARAGLEALALTTAELEAGMPERLESSLQKGLREEVLPVARHLAEVRGLSGQTIRRLERLQTDLSAERKARVEDLALLVDLVTSGWRGVEKRLDRIERALDRVERALDDRADAAPVYRIERKPGA
ncbi:MAG TPA: hypothetical protein VFW80_13025 [Gaiellaceae bacterium]|nr:hypothetical protein [Gaiellaceae bacterium]